MDAIGCWPFLWCSTSREGCRLEAGAPGARPDGRREGGLPCDRVATDPTSGSCPSPPRHTFDTGTVPVYGRESCSRGSSPGDANSCQNDRAMEGRE